MANDLHARLLAEIERREDASLTPEPMSGEILPLDEDVLAYLGALRKVSQAMGDLGTSNLARHKVLAAVAEALGVDVA